MSRTLVAIGVALGLVACASDNKTNTGGTGGTTTCAPGMIDANGDSADGCEYACVPGPGALDDPIDPQFVDENCDGSDGVIAKCVFVSARGSDVQDGGARTTPFRTIEFAQRVAKERGVDVCLAAERFVGLVTLTSGVSVYGGFNERAPGFAFQRAAKSGITTLTNPGTVVLAPSIDDDTRLEGLTIEATTDIAPGSGTYGVRVLAGKGRLFIQYNAITALTGADGTAGTNGVEGAAGVEGKDGAPGCNGCQQSIPPNGGSLGGESPVSTCGGAAGGGGGQGGYDQTSGIKGGDGSGATTGGTGGTGDATCSVSSGGPGTSGQASTDPGTNGKNGDPSPVHGALTDMGTYVPAAGGVGFPGGPGNAGGGGGGGGGGSNGGLCKGDRGGGGGSGGTGGCTGSPGGGAQGGGASFGIVARAGRVIVASTRIEAGPGGKGGVGGNGGLGGKGGRGGTGAAAGGDDGGAAGKGGDGSRGGSGGNGAGGVGGPNACIALTAGAVVDQSMKVTCTTTGGGKGGAGGGNAANRGDDGESSPTLTF